MSMKKRDELDLEAMRKHNKLLDLDIELKRIRIDYKKQQLYMLKNSVQDD